MSEFKLQDMPCVLCGELAKAKEVYPANFKPEDLTDKLFSARRLPDRIHYRILRCPHDGMIWSSPVLPPAEAARLYERSSFSYGEEVGPLTETYVTALQDVLKTLPQDARILEVGCGNGFVLQALYQKGFQNVHGVEPGREAVAKSSSHLQKKITVDMFREGLFPVGTFDLIFSFQTLDHLYDPNAFVAECFRLLKPGGQVLVFQHDVKGWSARLMGERSPIIDAEHIYLFSPATIRSLFKQHGFSVEKVYSPVNIVSLKHLIWLSPVPRWLKEKAAASRSTWLSWKLKVKLGNLCLIGRKEIA